YEIDEDKDAYYLPAFLAIMIAAAFGVRWLIAWLPSTKLRSIFSPLRAALLLMLIPIMALAGNFAYNNKRQYFIAHDYVTNILNPVEPGGMLLTTDWQVYSPMLYAHHIENMRGDVVVIDVNQLRRSWYFDYLNQVYPQVMEKSRDKVD